MKFWKEKMKSYYCHLSAENTSYFFVVGKVLRSFLIFSNLYQGDFSLDKSSFWSKGV